MVSRHAVTNCLGFVRKPLLVVFLWAVLVFLYFFVVCRSVVSVEDFAKFDFFSRLFGLVPVLLVFFVYGWLGLIVKSKRGSFSDCLLAAFALWLLSVVVNVVWLVAAYYSIGVEECKAAISSPGYPFEFSVIVLSELYFGVASALLVWAFDKKKALSLLATYVNVFFKPRMVFSEEKDNACWSKTLLNLSIAGVLFSMGYTLFAGVRNAFLGFSSIVVFEGLTLAFIIVFSPVIGQLVINLIASLTAKLLGGTGTVKQQIYLFSLYTPLVAILSAVLPLVPFVSLFLQLALELYALVLFALAVKEAHKLSFTKAFIAALIPVLIAAIIVLWLRLQYAPV